MFVEEVEDEEEVECFQRHMCSAYVKDKNISIPAAASRALQGVFSSWVQSQTATRQVRVVGWMELPGDFGCLFEEDAATVE